MPVIAPLSREHDRAGFDCGVPELNVFLKATARQHGEKGISRTFVLTEEDTRILGFFTLTLGEIQVDRLPAGYVKKYPAHGLPAVRLGRLAVSRRHQGKGYGELLLAEAIHRTIIIADHAGLIGLFVDAKDDNAKSFYERYGFMPLPSHPLHLFLPIATLRTADGRSNS
ncbi:GNAT family N-acetyltransferase [Geotalea toluenoxydans]|uniref:GNAT family N-acetyltransferase n=1 Tax=Geotalea toluenoxydans TaxID=421624 RepID=UPI0006D28B4C|nr:GNAT family N-acetyltransferase [Geotalea toluenoxydans]